MFINNSPCSLAFCLLLRAACIMAASGIEPLSNICFKWSGFENLCLLPLRSVSLCSSSSSDISLRPAHKAARPFNIISGSDFLTTSCEQFLKINRLVKYVMTRFQFDFFKIAAGVGIKVYDLRNKNHIRINLRSWEKFIWIRKLSIGKVHVNETSFDHLNQTTFL